MACVLDISFQSGEYHAHGSEYDEKSAAVKKGAQTLRKILKFHLISWGGCGNFVERHKTSTQGN